MWWFLLPLLVTGDCPPGQYWDTEACQDCPLGQYGDQAGQTGCKECWGGEYTDETGQTDCKDCGQGQYADETGQGGCKVCAEGKYADQTGQTECEACGQGRFGNGEGQAECAACVKGQFRNDMSVPECEDCQPGKYGDQTGQAGCKACAEGQYAYYDSQTECKPCERGLFGDQTGQRACKECEEGQYGEETGQTECKLCERGQYVEEMGRTECQNCSANTYNNQMGQTGCKECPYGQVNNETGRTSCDLKFNIGCISNPNCGCAENGQYFVYSNGPCPACPRGWGAGFRAVDRFNNTLRNSGGDVNYCQSCPQGQYDSTPPEGTNTTYGFVRNPMPIRTDDSASYYETQCTLCPAGFYQDLWGQIECKPCSPGRFNTDVNRKGLCDVCPDGQYSEKTGQVECQGCPGGRSTTESSREIPIYPRGIFFGLETATSGWIGAEKALGEEILFGREYRVSYRPIQGSWFSNEWFVDPQDWTGGVKLAKQTLEGGETFYALGDRTVRSDTDWPREDHCTETWEEWDACDRANRTNHLNRERWDPERWDPSDNSIVLVRAHGNVSEEIYTFQGDPWTTRSHALCAWIRGAPPTYLGWGNLRTQGDQAIADDYFKGNRSGPGCEYNSTLNQTTCPCTLIHPDWEIYDEVRLKAEGCSTGLYAQCHSFDGWTCNCVNKREKTYIYAEPDSPKRCNLCPENTRQTYSEGGITCESCPAGWEAPEFGSLVCTACSVGLVSSEGQPCGETCPRNHEIQSNGCRLCPAGWAGEGQGCTQCSAGKFSDEGGNCTECPVGQRATSERDACESCPLGQIFVNSTCQACGSHQYSNGSHCQNHSRLECPLGEGWTGSNYTDDSKCTPCRGGWSDTTGMEACKLCSPGYFAPSWYVWENVTSGNVTTLKNVTSGNVTTLENVTSDIFTLEKKEFGSTVPNCTVCPVGKVAQGGAERCSPCSPPLYQTQEGQAECQETTQETCDENLPGSYPYLHMCLLPENPIWGTAGCGRHEEKYIWRESLRPEKGEVFGHFNSTYITRFQPCGDLTLQECEEAHVQFSLENQKVNLTGWGACGWDDQGKYGMNAQLAFVCKRETEEVQDLIDPVEFLLEDFAYSNDCSADSLREFTRQTCLDFARRKHLYPDVSSIPEEDTQEDQERQFLHDFFTFNASWAPGCAVRREYIRGTHPPEWDYQVTWNENPRAACGEAPSFCACESDSCRQECLEDPDCYAYDQNVTHCQHFGAPEIRFREDLWEGTPGGPFQERAGGRGESYLEKRLEGSKVQDLQIDLDRDQCLGAGGSFDGGCTIIIREERSYTPPCSTTGY